MDSRNLKQRRVADDPNAATRTADTMNNYTGKREMRMKMAKRGLRSLAVAVSLPVALHLITVYLGSTTDSYGTASKPFWFPPMWGLRLTCLASSFLMGLSAWLVWAEGGFHKNPKALPVYLSQLVLSLAWDPIVFGAGAPWVGLAVCMGMFGALVGCSKVFTDVNPTAGVLIKPCLAWVAFLAVVNLKLVYI
ncbi:translocator protein homolog [Argentina anserina]|uniref:translocator protein homolog n=1 Tax=Argentina anserina TaxID=57926 RepID=UPI0021764D6F|nr:translocator protein homolog [Potentilla anserina]